MGFFFYLFKVKFFTLRMLLIVHQTGENIFSFQKSFPLTSFFVNCEQKLCNKDL